jgi:PAS domain S-box-containing protein
MPDKNPELYSTLGYWSKCLSVSLITIGCLVLIGWQFDIDVFKRPVPYVVAMNPLTAIMFIACGACLLLQASSKENNKRSPLTLWLSIFILGIALIRLISILTKYDLPVDTILYPSKLEGDIIGNLSNRMAPNTVFNFILAGTTLLMMQFETERNQKLGQFFALVILFLGLLSLLGYLYKVNSFYGIRWYIPMAVHSALTFLILALNMLFLNPDKGMMKNFTSSYSGSSSARLLVPAAIIIPALLGYLRLIGDWNDIYSKEFGVALLVLSIMVMFLLLIWFNASSLNKKDASRKEAEERLKLLNVELENKVEERTREVIRTERRFRSMIENAADIISLSDENNTIQYINPAILNISGYSAKEVMKNGRNTILHPDDRELAASNFQKALKNRGLPVSAPIRIIHKNGKTIWLEGIIKNLLHDESIKAVVANYRDVTARKEAEEKILRSENRIWETLDKMMEGIQIINKKWQYVYVNESVARQGKYQKEDLIGFTMMEKYPGIDQTPLFATLRKCMHENISNFIENEFEYADGSKGWFELSIQPVPEGIFILSIDITKRKAAEQAIQKLNEELEARVQLRTNQLEAVNKELESFSYSVSHDLRAPLRSINGYAKMIEEDYQEVLDDEGKRLLSIVQHNAQRMGKLIDDLLSFSRLGRKELQKSTIHAKEFIEAAINELNKLAPHHAEIKTGRLADFQADYALINQVFVNLLSNAVKYSSKKEKPVITIDSEIKNNEVIYRISDNGAGFDMKYSDKLFGVFQRLHSDTEFEGTGVGLAIVQRIITKHGGKVWAEGKVNEGATFYFSLPLTH